MKPKVLLYDIETAPIQAYTWGIYDQNVGLNQVISDWHLLSWSAKWLDKKNVMYMDQRKAKDITNDKKILQGLWNLLDEADIVITQNGKVFDQKKVYARFIFHGMSPPSPSKHIDTKQIAKKNFGFTSNGLAHLSAHLGGVPKSDHAKFPGMELWKECLKGNLAAWREMEKYNKRDVIALEAIYTKLRAWDNSVNINLTEGGCRSCGSFNYQFRGTETTSTGKYKRFQCTDCGAWGKSSTNLITKEQREQIMRKI